MPLNESSQSYLELLAALSAQTTVHYTSKLIIKFYYPIQLKDNEIIKISPHHKLSDEKIIILYNIWELSFVIGCDFFCQFYSPYSGVCFRAGFRPIISRVIGRSNLYSSPD